MVGSILPIERVSPDKTEKLTSSPVYLLLCIMDAAALTRVLLLFVFVKPVRLFAGEWEMKWKK